MAASFKATHEQCRSVRLYSKAIFSAVSELLLEAHIEVEDAILQKESIDTVWQILESTIKLAVNKFDPKSALKKRNAKNMVQ